MRVGQVLVVGARLLHLQDFGAQVRHRDAPGDRVRAVHRVLEHDVRVAGFELDFGQRREELARVDIGFPDAVVGHHLVVMLGDGNVGERLAHDDSWLSQFKASGKFDKIDTQINGLGEIEGIQKLYVEHTAAAMSK